MRFIICTIFLCWVLAGCNSDDKHRETGFGTWGYRSPDSLYNEMYLDTSGIAIFYDYTSGELYQVTFSEEASLELLFTELKSNSSNIKDPILSYLRKYYLNREVYDLQYIDQKQYEFLNITDLQDSVRYSALDRLNKR